MELYIPFLSNDNYINEYYRFREADEEVHNFIEELKYHQALFGIYIPDDAELKDIINNFTIEEVSRLEKLNNRPHKGQHIVIEYFKGKYYYFVGQVTFNTKIYYLEAKEFKTLLIKLVLAGIDVATLSDIEERISDYSEY